MYSMLQAWLNHSKHFTIQHGMTPSLAYGLQIYALFKGYVNQDNLLG